MLQSLSMFLINQPLPSLWRRILWWLNSPDIGLDAREAGKAVTHEWSYARPSTDHVGRPRDSCPGLRKSRQFLSVSNRPARERRRIWRYHTIAACTWERCDVCSYVTSLAVADEREQAARTLGPTLNANWIQWIRFQSEGRDWLIRSLDKMHSIEWHQIQVNRVPTFPENSENVGCEKPEDDSS